MLPVIERVARVRREGADIWTLEIEPAGRLRLPARPVQHALCVRRRRGGDLDQRRPGRSRPPGPHHPRRRPRLGGADPARSPATRSACADPTASAGRSTRPRAPTWSSSPAASASRRCARRSTACSPSASASAASSCCTARAARTTSSSATSSSAGARRLDIELAGHRRSRRRRLARQRRRRHDADPARRASTRRTPSPSSAGPR